MNENAGRKGDAAQAQAKQPHDAPPSFPVSVQRSIQRIADSLDGPDAKKDAAAESQRSERDVEAQEHMADWAPWMLGVGFAEIVLTLIGVVLLTLTYLETRTTSKETKRQFIATNRPRLKIRYLRMEPPVIGKPVVIFYEVVNTGDTRARIISNEITIRVNNAPREGDTIIRKLQFAFADQIANGEALIARTETPITPAPDWQHAMDGYLNDRVRVIGTITYMDDNGTTRRTGFWRQSTRDPNRFLQPDLDSEIMEEYEYED